MMDPMDDLLFDAPKKAMLRGLAKRYKGLFSTDVIFPSPFKLNRTHSAGVIRAENQYQQNFK